jgi:hypothetical protein
MRVELMESCNCNNCKKKNNQKPKKSLWQKTKDFFKAILVKLNDWTNIIIYLFVLILFFLPCILAFIWPSKTLTAIAVAYFAFWAGPITPAMPIQFAITFGIRALLNKLFPRLKIRHPIFRKKSKEEIENE